MIQNVEEFGAELGRKPFFYRPILEQGKIPIAEARVAEDIPTRRSEGSHCWSNQCRIALHVAPKGGSCIGVPSALGPQGHGLRGRKRIPIFVSAPAVAWACAERNRVATRSKVGRIPKEVPTVLILASCTDVIT